MPKRLLMLFALVFSLPSLAAEPISEYAMKATYLYNFAVFTEWPSGGETLNLCLIGQDRFGSALGRIEGKNVNGRRLSVARLSTVHNIKSCHILFVSEDEVLNMRSILDEVGELPVLIVTDTPVQSGAMIVVAAEGQRLTFDINNELAKRARLNISSKLLQLAKNVR